MKHYMISVPSCLYPMDFYGKTKREALNNFKQWAYISRLPKGYHIWLKVETHVVNMPNYL